MKYLLDTNICIYLLKGKFDIHKKIEAVGVNNCFISEITIAELKFGAENSEQKITNRKNNRSLQEKFKILPIYPALDVYAIEKAALREKGFIKDDFDLLIGAKAIYYNLILVTRNIKDFNKLNNIQIENWVEDEHPIN